jgi:tRNA threonylcarbamoyl adenosine modification protein YeaZ
MTGALSMKILAIDFSSPQRSVAVRNGDTSAEVVETSARTTRGLAMIEDALNQTHTDRSEIACIAIGIGPGSYTGIRASLALAQGWQLALGVKLLGISSAEAIAQQAHADGLRGQVDVVIDAQRGEFYCATYELDASNAREVDPLKIVSLEVMQQRSQRGGTLVGPDVARWLPGVQVCYPRALTLVRLAQHRTDFRSGEALEPIYLRETAFVKAPPPRPLPGV